MSYVLLLPTAALLGLACLPNTWINRRLIAFRNAVTLIASMQFLVAICVSVGLATGWLQPGQTNLVSIPGAPVMAASIYLDGVASLMLTLVSFIGWVICQYSIRYLDGEAKQGSYFRWTSLTLAAVCVMVVAGNLLMFLLAWVMCYRPNCGRIFVRIVTVGIFGSNEGPVAELL